MGSKIAFMKRLGSVVVSLLYIYLMENIIQYFTVAQTYSESKSTLGSPILLTTCLHSLWDTPSRLRGSCGVTFPPSSASPSITNSHTC
jgi:hypothetical protein